MVSSSLFCACSVMGELSAQWAAYTKISNVRSNLCALGMEKQRLMFTEISPDREFNLSKTEHLISITENELENLISTTAEELGPFITAIASTQPQSSVEQLVDAAKGVAEKKDETDFELIIPSYFFEEQDDSLDLELIPSFFLEELDESVNCDPQEVQLIPNSNNSNCIKGSLTEIVFSKWIRVFNNHNQLTMRVSCLNLKLLKELMLNYHQLSGKNRFTLLLANTRMYFDRGKGFQLIKGNSYFSDKYSLCSYKVNSDLFILLMDFFDFIGDYALCFYVTASGSLVLAVCSLLMAYYKENLMHMLVIKHGYASYSLFPNSVVLMFLQKSDYGDSGKLLVKMSQRNIIFENTLYSLVDKYYLEYVNELIGQHGYPSALFFEGSIVVVLAKEVEKGDGCQLLAQNLHQGKALHTNLLLPMPNESTYGQVHELFYALHHTRRWCWGGGTRFLFLLLKYGLHEGIAVLYLGSGNIFRVKLKSFKYVLYGFSDLQHAAGDFIEFYEYHHKVILIHISRINWFTHFAKMHRNWKGLADATRVILGVLLTFDAGEHRHGEVLPIPLHEFLYLLMLLFSIPVVVKVHIYLLEIGFLHLLLPPSEVYDSFSIHGKIIISVVYYTWRCLYSPYCARCFYSCCTQMVGLYKFHTARYLLPCYSCVWGLVYQANEEYRCTAFLVREEVIKDLFVKMLTQIFMEKVIELREFKLKHSSKWQDPDVPIRSCSPARDKRQRS